MTDPTLPIETPTKKPQQNMLVDLGPVVIFVACYHFLRRNNPDQAMVQAAGIFMVVATLALIYSRIKTGRFSGVLLFSTVIILITAGLTVFSGNPIFFYMKPTILNALFGVAAIGGVLIGKNGIKLLLGEAFKLPDDKWNTLAIRWGLFFFFLAALNEYIWRSYSEPFWVNFKLWGMTPLTFIFTMSQIPFILKYGHIAGQDKQAEESPPKTGETQKDK